MLVDSQMRACGSRIVKKLFHYKKSTENFSVDSLMVRFANDGSFDWSEDVCPAIFEFNMINEVVSLLQNEF